MKKIYLLISLILMVMLAVCGCGREEKKTEKVLYSVTDSQGAVVEFSEKPQKILTLSISTDTIALGLVPTERMAGVNAFLDDPSCSNIVPLAKKVKTKVHNPGAEEILRMKPDLVVVPDWGDIEVVKTLRDLGIKTVMVKGMSNLAEIKETVSIMAAAIGEPQKGEQLIAKMDAELADINAKLAEIPLEKRKKVVLISVMTSYGGIGCAYDDACKYAGVINGISDAGIFNGQQLTKEMLVKINPDILFMPEYTGHQSFDTQQFIDSYLLDPSLQTVTAIKNRAIVYPRDGYLYSASQDFVYCVREIARCAYGEAFDFPHNLHLSVTGEENK